jgi:hypothetical protein
MIIKKTNENVIKKYTLAKIIKKYPLNILERFQHLI